MFSVLTRMAPFRGRRGQQLYLWLESRAEITNVLYRMDSAIAPDRRERRCSDRVDCHLFW